MNKSLLGAVLVAAVLSVSACSHSSSVNKMPTQGQQLIDLKEAYDRGAISKNEYDLARQKILDGR